VPAAGDPAPRARWRLLVAYDGRGFSGFAAQPGGLTVAGSLAGALATVLRLGEPPPLVCAGRTDAGVHARGQVVHVDLPAELPKVRRGRTWCPAEGEDLVRSVNRLLAPAIVLRAAERAAPGFDARRSATWRAYRYLVWNAPVPDPLLAPVAWHVPEPLELRRMAAAADVVVGEHDFRAFCRRPPGTRPEDPLVRRVLDARWCDVSASELADGAVGRLLRFEVTATSFCHQMVRSIVATLVDVGRGAASPAAVHGRLGSPTRAGAPRPAPPHGLCLTAVGYD